MERHSTASSLDSFRADVASRVRHMHRALTAPDADWPGVLFLDVPRRGLDISFHRVADLSEFDKRRPAPRTLPDRIRRLNARRFCWGCWPGVTMSSFVRSFCSSFSPSAGGRRSSSLRSSAIGAARRASPPGRWARVRTGDRRCRASSSTGSSPRWPRAGRGVRRGRGCRRGCFPVCSFANNRDPRPRRLLRSEGGTRAQMQTLNFRYSVDYYDLLATVADEFDPWLELRSFRRS